MAGPAGTAGATQSVGVALAKHAETTTMAGQQRLAALSAHLLPASPAPAATPGPAAAEDSHMRTNVFANTVIMPSIGLGCAFVGSEDGVRSQPDITTEMVEAAITAGYRKYAPLPAPPPTTSFPGFPCS